MRGASRCFAHRFDPISQGIDDSLALNMQGGTITASRAGAKGHQFLQNNTHTKITHCLEWVVRIASSVEIGPSIENQMAWRQSLSLYSSVTCRCHTSRTKQSKRLVWCRLKLQPQTPEERVHGACGGRTKRSPKSLNLLFLPKIYTWVTLESRAHKLLTRVREKGERAPGTQVKVVSMVASSWQPLGLLGSCRPASPTGRESQRAETGQPLRPHWHPGP